MPVCEYECLECGAITQVAETAGGGRIAARTCAGCGSRRLRRVMSSFAYHKQVTLEDLGIRMPPPSGGAQAIPASEPALATEPPPGGCPYCSGDSTKE
jgi:putative FmdB family regulatory protein